MTKKLNVEINKNISNNSESNNNYGLKEHKNPANQTIYCSWSIHEKECLKKNLLIYGFGRWNIIREKSGSILKDKSDKEMKIFCISFIKCLIHHLYKESDDNLIS